MIELLPDLPEGVVGVRIAGQVTADDYRDVLVPAVEAALGDERGVRAVAVVESLEGYSLGAIWQDARLGIAHPRSWQRMALVTEVPWLLSAVAAFGWAVPGEVRVFDVGHVAAAADWAAVGDPST